MTEEEQIVHAYLRSRRFGILHKWHKLCKSTGKVEKIEEQETLDALDLLINEFENNEQV